MPLRISVEDACTRLIRTALISGGEDNIAVAVVRCAPLFRKLYPWLAPPLALVVSMMQPTSRPPEA